MLMSAQQFILCEITGDVLPGNIGVKKPMLIVSTANSNRAGSFIGYILPQARFLVHVFMNKEQNATLLRLSSGSNQTSSRPTHFRNLQ
jgi:hypothetical protein